VAVIENSGSHGYGYEVTLWDAASCSLVKIINRPGDVGSKHF
jgi:hypothetical protein